MKSQHWIRWWFGAIRQQPIILSIVETDHWCRIDSMARNELILYQICYLFHLWIKVGDIQCPYDSFWKVFIPNFVIEVMGLLHTNPDNFMTVNLLCTKLFWWYVYVCVWRRGIKFGMVRHKYREHKALVATAEKFLILNSSTRVWVRYVQTHKFDCNQD